MNLRRVNKKLFFLKLNPRDLGYFIDELYLKYLI